MKNAKKTKIENTINEMLDTTDAATVVENNHADAERIVAKTDAAENEKIMTCADVARELKIDPKRARAFLRKNVALYVCRNQRFTKTSKLYTQTRDALLNYAKTRTVVTE